MQIEKMEIVGNFLAILWSDKEESTIFLEEMRRCCPCAACAGEGDLTGRVYKPSNVPPLTEASFELLSSEYVGNYAISPKWGDGHDTGIYTWDYLRQMGAEVDDES